MSEQHRFEIERGDGPNASPTGVCALCNGDESDPRHWGIPPMTREPESQECRKPIYGGVNRMARACNLKAGHDGDCQVILFDNARLAPQDTGECYWDSELGLFCNKDSITARLREAEQRNPEVGFGYYYHDGCSLTQGDGESTVMLYHTDELQAQVNKETRRADLAEAQVTTLEAALNGLWRYTDHHSDCVLRRTVGPISDCDCGFGQAESICENAMKGGPQ